jgi:hypothetical protein
MVNEFGQALMNSRREVEHRSPLDQATALVLKAK